MLHFPPVGQAVAGVVDVLLHGHGDLSIRRDERVFLAEIYHAGAVG